jgi:hypothetical protein
MTDICNFVSLLFWLVIVVFLIMVILSALSSYRSSHPESHEEIHHIGAEARGKAQNLSEDFLRRVSDLLNEKRR